MRPSGTWSTPWASRRGPAPTEKVGFQTFSHIQLNTEDSQRKQSFFNIECQYRSIPFLMLCCHFLWQRKDKRLSATSFRKQNLMYILVCSVCSGSLNHSHERSRWAFSFSLRDLRSVTVKEEGWSFLVLKLKDSLSTLPMLHFHQGGSREFLDAVRRYALLSEWVNYWVSFVSHLLNQHKLYKMYVPFCIWREKAFRNTHSCHLTANKTLSGYTLMCLI